MHRRPKSGGESWSETLVPPIQKPDDGREEFNERVADFARESVGGFRIYIRWKEINTSHGQDVSL